MASTVDAGGGNAGWKLADFTGKMRFRAGQIFVFDFQHSIAALHVARLQHYSARC